MSPAERGERVAVVGAGLVGPVAAAILRRRGYRLHVYERGPDPRHVRRRGGASINLTLSARGLAALEEIGLADEVCARSVAASARVVHFADGSLQRLPYGVRGEALLSIRREELNRLVVDHAEARFGVVFSFGHACVGLAPARPELHFRTAGAAPVVRRRPCRVVAADGAFSAVRQRLQRRYGFDYSQRYSSMAYSQWHVPAPAGGWATMRDALHVWPREDCMLLAIPNRDESFTATLLLPVEGPRSHASLFAEGTLRSTLAQLFPDAAGHLQPTRPSSGAARAVPMVTIRCRPWTVSGRVLLLGDAAHAIYPSYGQGANAGLEDCVLLDRSLDAHAGDWAAATAAFAADRKRDTDVIADLSERHLDALSSAMGTGEFVRRHALEQRLAKLYPDRYRPLHNAISFTTRPYREVVARDEQWRPVVDAMLRRTDLVDRAGDGRIRATVRAAVPGADGRVGR